MAAMVIFSVIFVAVTFIDINIGLIAILLSMLLSPELEVGTAAGRAVVIRAEDLLLIIVSFTWLAKMAIKKAPLIKGSPLNIPIGLYVAVMCFSTARGMLSGNILPLKGMFYVFKIVEYFVLYFIVLNQITSEKQVKLFLGVLIFTSLVVGIYGNTHIGRLPRISAPFEGTGEPNTLGGYMLFILSILGGMIYYFREKRGQLFLVFVFLIPTFIFTLSRASYLGMLASLAAFVILSKDKRVLNWALCVALVFIVVFSLGPPVLKERIIGAFTPEAQQTLKKVGPVSLGPSPAARIESWHIRLTQRLPAKPLFGFGVTGTGFLDSQYIITLSETGVIGLVLFLWLMWRVWKSALNTFKKVKDPLFKGLTMGYMVGFAGLLTHAIGANSFIIIRIAEPFWFFTAIIVKLVDIERGKASMEEVAT